MTLEFKVLVNHWQLYKISSYESNLSIGISKLKASTVMNRVDSTHSTLRLGFS